MRILTLDEANLELGAYATLYNLIFSDYYVPLTISGDRLARQLSNGTLSQQFSLVVLLNDRPVALVLSGIEPVTGQLSVQALGVTPEFRRRGIGRAMLRELKDRAREAGVVELSLMVMRTNRRALTFYQEVGFHSVGTRECYILTLPVRLPRGSHRLKITKIPSALWGDQELNTGTQSLLVLVAQVGTHNVGHLVLSGEETLTLESLYVQPAWRRRRIATALLRAGLASSPLAQKVRVNYLPYHAKEMRRFLRRLGFRCFSRLEEMVLSLGTPKEGNRSRTVEGNNQEHTS